MTVAATTVAEILSVDPFGDRTGRGPDTGFLVIGAFLVAFLLIRTSARMTRSVSWWPGGVETGGVHYHHLIIGILLMMSSGFVAFAVPLDPPWWHITAILFGVGVGFTVDEFALWVRLEDVYWSEHGRMSFDAVVCTLAFAALVVLGTKPFGLDEPTSIAGTAIIVALVVGLALVCFAKNRVLLGVIGLFVPVVALAGAVRLARPDSPWAKWRYQGETLERAERRFAPDRPMERAYRRANDMIAGAPSSESDR